MAYSVTIRMLVPGLDDSDDAMAALRLCGHMQSQQWWFEYWAVAPGLERPFLRLPVSALATRALARMGQHEWLYQMLERRYRKNIRSGDVAYLWPGVTLDLQGVLQARGQRIILERTQPPLEWLSDTLGRYHEALGWPAAVRDETQIAEERQKLALADHLICGSPAVRDAHLACGIAADKLTVGGYGWLAQDVGAAGRRYDRNPSTFLFVGPGDVASGLPMLLHAWQHAAIDGRLVIGGPISPSIVERCGEVLDRDDVTQIPAVEEWGPLFERADVLVAPGIVAGTHSAVVHGLAGGLPCLLSSAAASGLVGEDAAVIVEADDLVGWVDGLRQLASDHALRRSLGEAARSQAAEFSWDAMSARRCAALEPLLLANTP